MAQFFKDYPLVIPAIATVLAPILGYIFIRLNATHSKKLEVQKEREKKDYERRAANHDRKIQEARVFVDSFDTLLGQVGYIIMLVESAMDSPNKETYLKQLKERLVTLETETPKLFRDIKKNLVTFGSLDKELLTLCEEFMDASESVLINVVNLTDKLTKSKNFDEGYTNFKESDELEKLSEDLSKARKAIIGMRVRLDKLEEKVP